MLRKGVWLLHLIGDKAIVMRLFAHSIGVVVLTPKTVDTVGVWAVSYPCRKDFPSWTKPLMFTGPLHMGLATMQTLFTCFLS